MLLLQFQRAYNSTRFPRCLHKQSVIIKQICKVFPQRRVNMEEGRKDGNRGDYDSICDARLPRGLDPHSVPSAELAASLGYMVQLLNLLVHCICVPVLHNSGFSGSCSRIWQRSHIGIPVRHPDVNILFLFPAKIFAPLVVSTVGEKLK